MSVAVLRLWADRLRDPSAGVNALLATIPRDVADPQPADVSVIEETEYYWGPREKLPAVIAKQTAPFLMITRASPETQAMLAGGPEVQHGSDEVDLMALYVGVHNAQAQRAPHEVMRDAMQTMRAVKRCTATWLDDSSEAAYAARARTDVQVVRMLRAMDLHLTATDQGAIVGAAFVVSFEVTDRWASAIT